MRSDGKFYCRGILVNIKYAAIMLGLEYNTLRRSIKKNGIEATMKMYGGENPGTYYIIEEDDRDVMAEDAILTQKEIRVLALENDLNYSLVMGRYSNGDRGEKLIRKSSKAYSGRMVRVYSEDGLSYKLYEGIKIAAGSIGRSVSAVKLAANSDKRKCNGRRIEYVESKRKG